MKRTLSPNKVRLLCFAFAMFGAQSGYARSSSDSFYMASVSPLRTAMGAPEVRTEIVHGNFGVGLNWSEEHRSSERPDYKDSSQVIRLDALWYPLGLNKIPVFAAVGIAHEDAYIGRKQERSSETWARTDGSEANDTWVNHDSYVSLTQSIGYRYLATKHFTASIAAIRDEIVTMSGQNEDRSPTYATTPDKRSHGRKRLQTGVALQVGMYLSR